MIQFTICGRVARDPEDRGGVVSFSIAVDQGFGDKKRGVFWSCKAFGKTGERVMQSWSKGKPMLASGRVEEDKWLDNWTGVERSKTILVVNECHFVPSDSSNRDVPQRVEQPAPYDGGDMPF